MLYKNLYVLMLLEATLQVKTNKSIRSTDEGSLYRIDIGSLYRIVNWLVVWA